MQRRWVMAMIVASGLLAQTPPQEPVPAPTQAPAPEVKPTEVKPEVQAAPAPPAPAAPKPFDQLRPTQRKLAYTLHRAALAAHELGVYRSHPRAVEVREALEALVTAKHDIPEKAAKAVPAVEAYLAAFNSNHGFYDATGKKVLLEGSWKDLQAAARATAKMGPKGLESRLAKLKGLLFDAKVDATAPSWAEPEAPAKGKKAKAPKGPKSPEGFSEQKALTAWWVKQAQAWVENTTQEVEVKGEKKSRRLPNPVQTKALGDLVAWLQKDDLELLRDPAFGWLDLRRLNDGEVLLSKGSEFGASKAPEGPAPELGLLPTLEPVMAEAKFGKGEEKRKVLAEVKAGPAPASAAEQAALFTKLGRSRDYEVK